MQLGESTRREGIGSNWNVSTQILDRSIFWHQFASRFEVSILLSDRNLFSCTRHHQNRNSKNRLRFPRPRPQSLAAPLAHLQDTTKLNYVQTL